MFNYLPEQAITCFLLYLLTNIQTASSNQPAVATKDGVLFNLHQKILLTEKFVKTEILVPYPVYNKTVKSKLKYLTRELASMWTSKNYGCPLNYTNMTESTSGLQWIAKQAIMENELAQQDIESLKIEMSQLHSHAATDTTSRKPRAAAAAVLGIGIGAEKLLCFIKSVFGGCDNRVKRNQENIRQAMAYLQYVTEHVGQITTSQTENFFMVSGELKAISVHL